MARGQWLRKVWWVLFLLFFLSYISGAGFPQGNARSIGSYALTGDKDVLFCYINYGKSLWRVTCRLFFLIQCDYLTLLEIFVNS